MSRLFTAQVQETLNACCYGVNREIPASIKVDSREIHRGDMFIALPGEKTDGYRFIQEAIARGARVILARKGPENQALLALKNENVTFLFVEDPFKALVYLAKMWLEKIAPKVIGVTGSVGKTTVRELTTHVLQSAASTHSAVKSYNTLVGCSLTLLSMDSLTQYLVLEYGTNHFGEIAEMAAVFPPHKAIITEVAPAHLEGFKSIEGVLKAKLEITQSSVLDYMSYNSDNESLSAAMQLLPDNLHTIGVGYSSLDFQILSSFQTFGAGCPLLSIDASYMGVHFRVDAPVFGVHHAYTIGHAYVLSAELGIRHDTILESIQDFSLPSGRGRVVPLHGGGFVLDDSYNSNPCSLGAAFRTVHTTKLPYGYRRIAVISGMRELGEQSECLHRSLIKQLDGFDGVFLIGREWKNAGEPGCPVFARTDTTEELIEHLKKFNTEKSLILLKGSRYYRLESLLPYLGSCI